LISAGIVSRPQKICKTLSGFLEAINSITPGAVPFFGGSSRT